MYIFKNFAIVVFCLLSFTVSSQNCSVTTGTTTQLSQNQNVCQYESVVNFSATNTNSANSLTITTGNGSIVMVTNPAGVQDITAAFSFTSNFNGAYTIKYNVPCDQTSIDFVFTYDGPGNGDCSMTTDLINLSPLAVSLTDFYYKYQFDDVILLWSTTNEKDNKGFEIEKSKDGFIYEQIAFVPSQNQNVGTSYRTKVSKESSYYRLIQLDIDGVKTILGTVYVNASEGLQITASQIALTLSNTDSDVVAEISNMNGQLVSHQTMSRGNRSIDISQLAQGVYYIKIVSNGIVKSLPFVKF